MQIQRDLGFHVTAHGGVSGQPRRTEGFKRIPLKSAISLFWKAEILAEESSQNKAKKMYQDSEQFKKYQRLYEEI